MKKLYLFLFLSVFTLHYSQKNLTPPSDFYFYENKGQIIDQDGKLNPKVKYLFNSGGLNVQIKKEGFSYDVYEVEKTKKRKNHRKKENLISLDKKPQEEFDYKFKYHRVDIDFLNANKNPEIIAEGKSTDYENYYNIPGKPEGVTEVHRYQKITYKNIYPNVDLVFFKPKDTTKSIEYNFIINPGGRISNIKLKFKGAKTKLKDGKLSMNLRFGEMQENIPHSWIEDKAAKTNLSVQFKEIENSVFGFEAPQDSFEKKVVIDPVPTRIWGSYFSGSYYDNKSSFIRSDSNENLYFGGQTKSLTNIATVGTHQFYPVNNNNNNGFVQKFDINGMRIWGTYIGNLSHDTEIYDGAITDEGIYIGGNTYDGTGGINLITTPGVHKQFASPNSREAFLMKLDFTGKRVWGTYYGGNGSDDIFSISIDRNYNIFVSGQTNSSDQISTNNGLITTLPNLFSGFFAKFDKDAKLIYGSYFYKPVDKIAVDNLGNFVITGMYFNQPNNLPKISTPNSYQENMIGYYNSYIIKFDNNFNKQWGTYFGGNTKNNSTFRDNNYINGLAIDNNNDIIIAGTTDAKDNIATKNAYKEKHLTDNNNGFIAKFSQNGNILWSTYFGGEGFWDTEISDLYVKENGNIYITGDTRSSTDISSIGAFQMTSRGSDEGFFAKFNSSGNKVWGTYYGDRFQDWLQKITAKNNFVYVIGYSTGFDNSNPLGTSGTFMPNAYAGYYLAKFQDCQNNVLVSSNSPVCPNTDIKLQASGGTSYSWTGPNGFTSTDQNPIIPNATFLNSGTYSCVISGTGDCDGTFTVDVKVEDKTPPTPDIVNLQDITGDCHTVVSTIPTATDNCSGKINATTTDALQYSIPGTYTITWKYDDGNGNIFTQTQKVIITSPALPTAISPQTFCATNAPKISNISITGQNIIWYDASGSVINTATPLIDGTTYYASQTINSCESDKITIQVKVNATPLPTGNANQDFCTSRNAQVKDLIVTGTSLKYYDNLGNSLPLSTVLQDNTSYFVTQTLNNCESPKFEIKVTLTANSLPAQDYQLVFCNDTTANYKTEDLRKYQENIITGSSAYSFEYFDQNNNSISDFANRNLLIGINHFYVKVKSNDGCWKTVKLILQLNPKPLVNLPSEAEYCRGLFVELDAGSGYASYLWNTGATTQKISVNKEGTYTVKVTNSSNCENSSSTLVKQSVLATIIKVEIFNNNAKVLLSANGDFEFSLDNVHWQDSNEFKNLGNGNHTMYVKTKMGCIIGQMNFTIFNINNSFTPNGDGINDTWIIDGIENYPNSEIIVWDRYSIVVLKVKTSGSFQWNGYFNGRVLPTGTYWYIIKVSDGRVFQGSLLIKNRN